jgi:hypothetical protein
MCPGRSRGTYKDLAMDWRHVWVEIVVLVAVVVVMRGEYWVGFLYLSKISN